MSLVAERLLLSWASARSAGGAFSLLRGMDLECFKPKFSWKDHTIRQENGFSLSVYCGLNDKKIKWLGKTFIDQKSVVELLIPDPLGCQEDIKTESSHCFFPLIKRCSTDTNGYNESMFLLPVFHILYVRHLMQQFVFILQTVSSCVRGLSHKVMCWEEMPKEISSISSPLFKDYFS